MIEGTWSWSDTKSRGACFAATAGAGASSAANSRIPAHRMRSVLPRSLRPVNIESPHGPARAHLHEVANARALLILGHGAGGGVTAPDLTAATEAAHAADVSVALVEQPYRVAGRKSAA